MRAAGLQIAGIVLSAFLLALALPLGERSYLAGFALVPLLVIAKGKGFVWGFGSALLMIFLSAWLAASGLLYEARNPEGEAAWIYTGCGLFGFAAAFATALWADPKLAVKPAWWFAACAVLLEAALLVQLPSHLALTQYRNPVAMTLASVGGIWLVSFLLWWANFALARMPVRFGIAAGVAVALISSVRAGPVKGDGGILVSAVQCPIDSESSLESFHRQAAASGASIVVWPEFGGILFVRHDDAARLKTLGGLAPLVTSFPDSASPLPHNVAALYSQGGESTRYSKRRLFGGRRSSTLLEPRLWARISVKAVLA